jgi:hypothetical protein
VWPDGTTQLPEERILSTTVAGVERVRLAGEIERRLLVNYRVDPDVVHSLLPPGLRPQVVAGFAVAGICLIRLGAVRPVGFPRWVGQRSENAAHRIAVEWDTPDGTGTGVYIPRRDSGSLLNVAVGGRLFPGRHHRARFHVVETEAELQVGCRNADGSVDVNVHGRITGEPLASSLFPDLAAASRFFRQGAVGWSPGPGGALQGLRLVTTDWRMDPVVVDSVRSSFTTSPPGSRSGRPPSTARWSCDGSRSSGTRRRSRDASVGRLRRCRSRRADRDGDAQRLGVAFLIRMALNSSVADATASTQHHRS